MQKKHYKFSLFLILCLCFSLIGGCTPSSSNTDNTKTKNATTKIQKEFDAFLDDEFKDTLLNADPFTFHSLVKDPANFDISAPEIKFKPVSVKEMKEEEKENETCYQKLMKYDRSKLTEEQQLTYDTMKDYLETAKKCNGLYYWGSYYEPSQGLQKSIPQDLAEYQFYSKKDVENYFEIIRCLPDYLKSTTDFEEERAKNGLGMQDSSLDATLSDFQSFLDKKEDSCLFSTFTERLNSLKDITQQEKENYEQENKKLINEVFFPAFIKARDAIMLQKGKSSVTGGLSQYDYKNGRKYYRYLAAAYTGSSEGINTLTKNIENQIEKDEKKLAKLAISYPDCFSAFDKIDFGSDDPKKSLETLKTKTKKYYPSAPKVNYEIRNIDKSMADDITVAYYRLPPIDDITDNYIYINVNRSDYDPKTIYPTLAHEGYPGHLLQNTYYKSVCKYPIRQVMSFLGYTEGWAMYTELSSYQLADLDKQSKGLTTLCQLNDQLNYGLQCRCDIGINYEGWNKKDLKTYLSEFGMNDSKTIDTLYQSSIDNPGIYLSYYYGWLQMWKLRENAQQKLGKNFNIKEYHTIILNTGATSFDILTKKVNEYISRNK